MLGLVGEAEIARQVQALAALDIDSYIEAVVTPASSNSRRARSSCSPDGAVVDESSNGPYYLLASKWTSAASADWSASWLRTVRRTTAFGCRNTWRRLASSRSAPAGRCPSSA